MELKLPEGWQGDIFCDNAQQFKDNATCVRVEQGGTNHIHHGGNVLSSLSAEEAFRRVILAMVKSHHLSEKNDFGIIYKLDVEMHVMGFKQFKALAEYLEKLDELPDKLRAQACSVSSYSFGSGMYPNWIFDDKLGDEAISHIHSVAREYIRQMAMLGFFHPRWEAPLLSPQGGRTGAPFVPHKGRRDPL